MRVCMPRSLPLLLDYAKSRFRSCATGVTEQSVRIQEEFMLNDLCLRVNEFDEVLGYSSKKECHRILHNTTPLHRAFSLFLFRHNPLPKSGLQLLVQRRSPSKFTFPTLWSNTCCSHPIANIPHETVEENALGVKWAAARKVEHELGIRAYTYMPVSSVHFLTRIVYFALNEPSGSDQWAEHELDYILVSVLSKSIDFSEGPCIVNQNPEEADIWIEFGGGRKLCVVEIKGCSMRRTLPGIDRPSSDLIPKRSWPRRIFTQVPNRLPTFGFGFRFSLNPFCLPCSNPLFLGNICMTLEQVPLSSTNRNLTVNPLVSSSATPQSSSEPALANLWTQLDRIQPTIPDRLSVAILEGVGVQFENGDPRLARLVSLAGQKFITDILTDAMGHWRLANGLPSGLLSSQPTSVGTNATTSTSSTSTTPSVSVSNASPQPGAKSSNVPNRTPDRRATLTLEDLITTLNDRGVHVARPEYYRQLQAGLCSTPTSGPTDLFPSRQDWMDVICVFAESDEIQKRRIVHALDAALSDPSLTNSPGVELFIPVLFETLLVKNELLPEEGTIFRLLTRITHSNRFVDYAGSLGPVLVASAKFMCTHSVDIMSDLTFVDAIISHAVTKRVNISTRIEELLDFFSEKCAEPTSDIWKHVLICSKLMCYLPHTASLRSSPPDWLRSFAKFVIGCLQTNRLMQNPMCRYAVFELSSAMSRFCANSLSWLTDLCMSWKPMGEPFAVWMTSVIVELHVLLPRASPTCQHSSEISGRCQPALGFGNFARLDSSKSNDRLLELCSNLFRLGVEQMLHRGTTDDDLSVRVLANYLEDQAASSIWLQLCDLTDCFKHSFGQLCQEIPRLLRDHQTDSSTIPTTENPTVRQAIWLLPPYLTWLDVYYQTHCQDQCDQKPALDRLCERLITEDLSPICDILWPLLCVMLSDNSPRHTDEHIVICLSKLASLTRLFDEPKVSRLSYKFDCQTFGELLLSWVGSSWSLPFKRDNRTVLSSALYLINCTLRRAGHEPCLLCNGNMLSTLLSGLPNPKKSSTAEFELYTETLIFCLYQLTHLLSSSQMSQHENGSDARILDLLNGALCKAERYALLLDSPSLAGSTSSVREHLREAIEKAFRIRSFV
ncbi:hypothetical protein P879_00272 [Paragonimus westermani]|uniref:isopentenyl-diphosphate Delta-isomerase n=1 Tax=Paragonimus westermani TaxID=34504 RepID=A0A8T0DWY7_9TREM|nr:hypothetical protein P879_00272 [Paragonimus westermani]